MRAVGAAALGVLRRKAEIEGRERSADGTEKADRRAQPLEITPRLGAM